MESQVLYTVWCRISGEAAGEIWTWSLLGVKGLIQCEGLGTSREHNYKQYGKWNS